MIIKVHTSTQPVKLEANKTKQKIKNHITSRYSVEKKSNRLSIILWITYVLSITLKSDGSTCVLLLQAIRLLCVHVQIKCISCSIQFCIQYTIYAGYCDEPEHVNVWVRLSIAIKLIRIQYNFELWSFSIKCTYC